jgi:hypothetical protein
MACLGGTVGEHGNARYPDTGPLRWTRYYPDGRVEEGEGRTCKRTAPWAGPKTCSSCVLFQGVDRWGQEHTGLNVNDEPIVLSGNEREMYEAAQEAAFDDDNFIPMDRFVRRMRGEVWGMRRLALAGDPDASEERAAQMRTYRASHPEYRRKDAAAAKLRMRRYRERKKLRDPLSSRS